MTLMHKVVEKLADGQFHSGEALAIELAVTRASIWKAVKAAQQELGLEVHCVRGRGYRLGEPLELLSASAIAAGLAADSPPAAVEVHFELDSTNSYLLSEAKNPPHPRVVFAERQRAGRGRRGRHWVSPVSGNLYFSTSWPSARAPAYLSGLSLAAGIAVCEVLRRYLPSAPKLKWPNDIVVGARKLAGILVDMQGEAQGPSLCVVGVGLNVHLPRTQAGPIEQPWVDLRSLRMRHVPRNTLAAELVIGVLEALSLFEREGMQAFVRQWREYDQCYGQPVVLELPQCRVEGVAAGIDEQGALLLERDGRLERHHSGEVSMRVMKPRR